MHKIYLQQAIDLANDNVQHHNGGPYGAVIVKAGKVIAATGNQVVATLDPTAHAEVMAIRQACHVLKNFRLSDCILYSSCEPCPMCLGAIYWAHLQQVYYACNRIDAAKAGFDDGCIYKEIQLPAEQRHIPMQQLELVDAQKPFITWAVHKNAQAY